MTENTHRALEAEAACIELFSTKLICEEKKKKISEQKTHRKTERTKIEEKQKGRCYENMYL